ncbi:MAG: LuxR C-terminal-related transcriptional regulator [Rikenellaceae bacterium]
MAHKIHIIIAEPSAIIRCGLSTLLQEASSINCDIVEVSDLTQLSTASFRFTAELLIANPSHLGLFSPAQLKGDLGNENLKVIALQSTVVDQSLLQNYDDAISIYDSIEKITEKILALSQVEEEPNDKRDLSAREKEIIVCVVKGLTNKQIAATLHLSTHTVIAHRRNIASKLQIHSPAGLTIYAIVNKLVDLSDIKNSISQSREE